MEYTIHPIAHIRTDFTDKFGIPRQSGLVPELTARIVFEPEYRDPNALARCWSPTTSPRGRPMICASAAVSAAT